MGTTWHNVQPELWASLFEKKIKVDKTLTYQGRGWYKLGLGATIWVSTQVEARICSKNSQLIHNPMYFLEIHESAQFMAKVHNPYDFKAKSVNPQTYSPPSFRDVHGT